MVLGRQAVGRTCPKLDPMRSGDLMYCNLQFEISRRKLVPSNLLAIDNSRKRDTRAEPIETRYVPFDKHAPNCLFRTKSDLGRFCDPTVLIYPREQEFGIKQIRRKMCD
jgi:hypothetical protein